MVVISSVFFPTKTQRSLDMLRYTPTIYTNPGKTLYINKYKNLSCISQPTSCMSEAPHLLAINVCFVPDHPVDKTRPSRVPALVQPSLDWSSHMHFWQTAQGRDGRGRGWRCEEDTQQGEVTCRSGTQIVQLHEGSWNCNFFLHCLQENNGQK